MKMSVNLRAIKLSLIMTLLLTVGFNGQAQTESINQSKSVSITTTEDGKVKLKVTTKEGDDSKTFEKTYDSYDDIKGDPDLEKYGIELDGFGGFGSSNGSFRFGQGGMSPMWDDDSFMRGFGLDSLRSQMRNMMRNGFGGNNFFFNFGDDEPFMMDLDSLGSRYNFNFGNGGMFFNGEEITDMDSLRSALKDKFGSSPFDFNFDFDNDGGFDFHGFNDDDGVKVISRARVIIRSAKDKDKEIAGTDKMEELEIRDVSFYPNPSDGRFNLEVETGNKGPLQVKIVSPTGEVIYDKVDKSGLSSYNFDIDISDKDEGIYILKVIQNNKALTKRIVIE